MVLVYISLLLVNYGYSNSSEHNVFDLTGASSTLQKTRAEPLVELTGAGPCEAYCRVPFSPSVPKPTERAAL